VLKELVQRFRSPVWSNRDYMLLWGGQTISQFGTSISTIAFPLLILALTNSPALAGIAGGLRAGASLLLGIPAGALVDRWDLRRTMLFCDAGRAITLGSLPLALWLGHVSLAQIYAVAAIEGVLSIFYDRAALSALPRIVPKEQLAAATGQTEGTHHLTAELMGPAAGGVLYGLGRSLPFLTDAASYLLSFFSLLPVGADLRPKIEGRLGGLGAEMREGLAWMWRMPLVRSLSLLDAGPALVWSGVNLMVIVLAKRQGASPSEIGTIFSVAAVGGILGSIAGSQMQKLMRFGRTMIWVMWAPVLLLPLYAVAPNTFILGILTAGTYFLGTVKNVTMASNVLPLIPDELRGRVLGVSDIVPAAAGFAGPPLVGLALEYIGPSATPLAFAAILLPFALFATLDPHVRNAPSATE
jgi:MFS family permease